MSDFSGMASYEEDEIRRALSKHKELYNKCNKIMKDALSAAKEKETSYRFLGFLWKVNSTVYLDMEDHCDGSYGIHKRHTYLFKKGIITEYQKNSIEKHKYSWWNNEYNSVKALFEGDRKYYLNPDQAKFIKFYKDFEEEE